MNRFSIFDKNTRMHDAEIALCLKIKLDHAYKLVTCGSRS